MGRSGGWIERCGGERGRRIGDGCKRVWIFGFLVDEGFRYEIETLSEQILAWAFIEFLPCPKEIPPPPPLMFLELVSCKFILIRHGSSDTPFFVTQNYPL